MPIFELFLSLVAKFIVCNRLYVNNDARSYLA